MRTNIDIDDGLVNKAQSDYYQTPIWASPRNSVDEDRFAIYHLPARLPGDHDSSLAWWGRAKIFNASDSFLASGSNPGWQRRLASVMIMFLGAAAGVLLLRNSLALALGLAGLIASACVIAVLAANRTGQTINS